MIGMFNKTPSAVWRQGDVYLIAQKSAPSGKRLEHRAVLAEGEITGHAHRLADPAAAHVFSIGADLFMEVVAESATIVHEEHGPVTIPRGSYAVRIQREYSPKEIRRVVD